ncbi:hypothetical protein EV363DRAFT_1397994 [Boletus edulis]|nr:hypothetical protein EV363DRAFT_1397994 [Boletus edulis]
MCVDRPRCHLRRGLRSFIPFTRWAGRQALRVDVPRAKSLPHINLVAEGPSISSPHLSSQAPSSTSLTGQTTVASTVPAKPARSPELCDVESTEKPNTDCGADYVKVGQKLPPSLTSELRPEESHRESDNFSFHFSQDEEWTDEVEARMQNAIDRMLEDARRQIAEPILNFSVLFPDDLLADSVAHQTANPRTPHSGASSLEDYGDQDDETEEDDGLGVDNAWEELATGRSLSFKYAMSPSSTPSIETLRDDLHQRIRRVTGCFDLRVSVDRMFPLRRLLASPWFLTSPYDGHDEDGSQTWRKVSNHRFHQGLLTSTYDRGGGDDGNLLTPTNDGSDDDR